MKTLKEKRGFTLIELLAVIVVLAIVSVLATTTVLPYLSESTRNTFALEANGAIEAASNAMSLIQIGTISGSELIDSSKYSTNTSGDTTTYCFSVEKLVELGLLKMDSDRVATGSGKTPEYKGTVVVTTSTANKAYTYAVEMQNKKFYVKKASGNVDGEKDVKEIPSSGSVTIKTSCS